MAIIEVNGRMVNSQEIDKRAARLMYMTKFCMTLSEDAWYDWERATSDYEIPLDIISWGDLVGIALNDKLFAKCIKAFKHIVRAHNEAYLREALSSVCPA